MDSDLNIVLTALRNAINKNPNQFDRAKTDPMYSNFRKEVNTLLEDLIQEKRTIAEKEYRDLEYSAKNMKKWFDSDYASSDDTQKYKLIHDKIIDTKSKLKTQSYVGYDDSLKIIPGSKEIVSEIQISIKQRLRNLETQFELRNKELGGIPDKLHKIETNKQRVVFLNLFALIGTIIIFRFSLIVGNELIFEIPDPTLEPLVNFFAHLITMLFIYLIKLVVLLGGIPVAIYFLFILIISFGRLFVSDDQTKKLISKRNELNAQMNMLKHQITTAKESLI